MRCWRVAKWMQGWHRWRAQRHAILRERHDKAATQHIGLASRWFMRRIAWRAKDKRNDRFDLTGPWDKR